MRHDSYNHVLNAVIFLVPNSGSYTVPPAAGVMLRGI